MKKNVAGQKIGFQMVSAADGSAFTGAVTVYVTGDAGTQAVGSVGSGAATHEGNGFHTYAPAQAETNYDHIAFTAIGTGAVPATIQIYTTFPQTGDSYARLGAPAGASVSADIATVDTVADGIKAVTDVLPNSGALTDIATGISSANTGITGVSNKLGSPAGASVSDDIAAIPTAGENRAEMDSNSTKLTAILADTGELQADWANGGRLDNLLDGAASAGDPWTTSLPGAYAAGTAGYIIGNNINATVSSRSSHSAADVWSAATRTLTAATNLNIPTAAQIVDEWEVQSQADGTGFQVNVKYINSAAVTGTGTEADPWT